MTDASSNDSLFQPATLIPHSTGLDIHDGDDGGNLEEKVNLLPAEMSTIKLIKPS